MKSAESLRSTAGAAQCIISVSRKKTADSLFFHRTGIDTTRMVEAPNRIPREKLRKFMAMAGCDAVVAPRRLDLVRHANG
jgi:hypothetical protein